MKQKKRNLLHLGDTQYVPFLVYMLQYEEMVMGRSAAQNTDTVQNSIKVPSGFQNGLRGLRL